MKGKERRWWGWGTSGADSILTITRRIDNLLLISRTGFNCREKVVGNRLCQEEQAVRFLKLLFKRIRDSSRETQACGSVEDISTSDEGSWTVKFSDIRTRASDTGRLERPKQTSPAQVSRTKEDDWCGMKGEMPGSLFFSPHMCQSCTAIYRSFWGASSLLSWVPYRRTLTIDTFIIAETELDLSGAAQFDWPCPFGSQWPFSS